MTKRWDLKRTAARSGFKDGISKHRCGVFLKALKNVFDSWFVRNGRNGAMVKFTFAGGLMLRLKIHSWASEKMF